MSELTEAERGQIIGLFKVGATKASIKKSLVSLKQQLSELFKIFKKETVL